MVSKTRRKENKQREKRIIYPKLCSPCKESLKCEDSVVACNHCKKQACQHVKVEGKSLCVAHQREESAKSTRQGRQKERNHQQLGLITTKSPPVILWFDNAPSLSRKECLDFVQSVTPVKARAENFSPNSLDVSRKNVLPPHNYKKIQFYNGTLLEAVAKQKDRELPARIRNLANGEHGIEVAKCVSFSPGHFLERVADTTIETIKGKGQFEGAVRINALNQTSPFQFTFGAVALHIQDDEEALSKIRPTSAYYPHIDTFGSVVLFLQLTGVSFTFVAIPEGTRAEAEFEEETDHWRRYKQWKAYASMEDSSAMKCFENDFLRQATEKKQMRVMVYELLAGQRLCFAAGRYLHASIIPTQVRGALRTLLVFHELEQCSYY